MSKPRVFVSSTYYDLKHIRSSLAQFIESLGFESILSERGDIPYISDQPLDKSCYQVAGRADIFVLIIGDRYGSEASSEASSEEEKPSKKHLDHYDSVTKKEYEEAVSNGVPVFILVDGSVYIEYRTYLQNKGNKDVKYAHVDDVNIFVFIEDILAKKQNSPVYAFDRFTDIENWLKEQWAGLFQELLRRMSDERQLSSLTSQVEALKEINNTLKKYLEAVLSGKGDAEKKELIEAEQNRLEELVRLEKLREIGLSRYILRDVHTSLNSVSQAMIKATSYEHFLKLLNDLPPDQEEAKSHLAILKRVKKARIDFNKCREVLGLTTFPTAQKVTKKDRESD